MKRNALHAVVLTLALPGLASAQGLRLNFQEWMNVSGQASDGLSTYYNVTHGCSERNQLVGAEPRVATILPLKAAVAIGSIVAARYVKRAGHPKLAAFINGLSAGAGHSAGLINWTADCRVTQTKR